MAEPEEHVSTKLKEEPTWYGELMNSPFTTMAAFFRDAMLNMWVTEEEGKGKEKKEAGIIWKALAQKKKYLEDKLQESEGALKKLELPKEAMEGALTKKNKLLSFVKSAGKLLGTLVGVPIIVTGGLIVGLTMKCIKSGMIDGISECFTRETTGIKKRLKGLGKFFLGVIGLGGIGTGIAFGAAPIATAFVTSSTAIGGLYSAGVAAMGAFGLTGAAAATTFVGLVAAGLTMVGGVVGKRVEKVLTRFSHKVKSTLETAKKTIESGLQGASSRLASELSEKRASLHKIADEVQSRGLNQLEQMSTLSAKIFQSITTEIIASVNQVTKKQFNTVFTASKTSVVFSGTNPLDAIVAASKVSDLKLTALKYTATLPGTATKQDILRFIEKAEKNGINIQAIQCGINGTLCPIRMVLEGKENRLKLADDWQDSLFPKEKHDRERSHSEVKENTDKEKKEQEKTKSRTMPNSL